MTDNDIKQAVNMLAKALLAKGLSRSSAKIEYESNTQIYGVCWYNDDEDKYQSLSEFGDTYEDVSGSLLLQIANIPSKEDRERNKYLQKLAAAIEYGKKIGIDEAFINPLELQMKKLSANIIEYRTPWDVEKDGVPF